MNKYIFILILLMPHFVLAVKEADTSNFIQMSVSRLSRQNMAPLAPIIIAIQNPPYYNYPAPIQLALHFEFNYQQARNAAANMGLKYTF